MSAPSSATLIFRSLLAAGPLASLGMLLGQGRALLNRLRGSTQDRRKLPRGHPRLAYHSFSLL